MYLIRFVKKSSWLLALLLYPMISWGDPVDINQANAQALQENLIGVGPKKAQAIVEWRAANGNFKDLKDFLDVPGVGPKLVEKNRDNLLISGKSAVGMTLPPAEEGKKGSSKGKNKEESQQGSDNAEDKKDSGNKGKDKKEDSKKDGDNKEQDKKGDNAQDKKSEQ